MSQPNAFDEK